MVRYAALRIILLAAVGGVLYLIGMRSYLLVATSIIVAAMLAYILFPSQRNEAARAVEAIASQREVRTQIDADNEAEDADADIYHQTASEADHHSGAESRPSEEDGEAEHQP